ncbi:Uncharacterised protein [Vibrio cholerae]|nr:Uncharacterised protein [Vibrio cholerae]
MAQGYLTVIYFFSLKRLIFSSFSLMRLRLSGDR